VAATRISCVPYRRGVMHRRTTITTWLISGTLVVCANFFAPGASGQITRVINDDGRQFFVNAEPPLKVNLNASKSRANIWLPAESSFTGHGRPAMDFGRDGVEKLVREASDRHRVDPALVRAVIETESNWNPKAYSRKGAGGLMQLIPTTAQRYGAYDVFNPQQNIDAGVKHLKWLLERYNGNLDLALAAYNAGEGAVDRAHGVPAYRETQNYVQKVQNAYFRPGSGRLPDAYVNSHAIRRDVTADGRIIFSNE
jgi:transglycosylase-like protein with SLT domain